MPTIHISQELYDFIQSHKHEGQSHTGFISELVHKHYKANCRNPKGQFTTQSNGGTKYASQ